MAIGFNYNDGGRSRYFKAKGVGDCVVRALAIATNSDYKEVYDKAMNFLGYSPRNGIKHKDTKNLMVHFGGFWHPTVTIGSGCKVHLRDDELPKGRIVCSCSRHLVAVINGIINDTYDCSRNGTRCVYGYWVFETKRD